MSKITLAHGSGGKITHKLIKDVFLKYFGNEFLNKVEDSAVLSLDSNEIAFTTDSFVVKPLFFPGGDIGKLSICGTVNDLAVSGAIAQYISCGFIIEEGFDEGDLIKIVESMSFWANQAGVKIVTGDTKVVEKGSADGLFINTSGIGVIKKGLHLGVDKIAIGDKIILTGTIGDHGIAVLSKRKGIEFEAQIISDCAPLNKMILSVIDKTNGVKFMRDPTRGGLATTLNEITGAVNFGLLIEEEKIPISESVRGVCELLGFDPLYIANEGKAILIVEPLFEKSTLDILRNYEYGRDAVTIGEITKDNGHKACIRTRYGITRIIDMLSFDPIPRIC